MAISTSGERTPRLRGPVNTQYLPSCLLRQSGGLEGFGSIPIIQAGLSGLVLGNRDGRGWRRMRAYHLGPDCNSMAEMDFGVHLPLMDFGDQGLSWERLERTVGAARDCGFAAVSANDHFIFS